MLSGNPKRGFSDTKVVSIIGQGTTVTGEIKSTGTIRIEGNVAGKVHSDDTIVIHESGKVKADLYAGQVVISGEVQGNVYAQERLEITSTAKVLGDITSPRIAIAEGVMFEGKCTMKAPGQQPKLQEIPREGAGPSQAAAANT